jgi:hypothetical protein
MDHLAFKGVTGIEREVIADARGGWNDPLAERLRSSVRRLAVSG